MYTKLPNKDEVIFREWYKGHSQRLNLHENPDYPSKTYDYRGAFEADEGPDDTGHWPEKFNLASNPGTVQGKWENKFNPKTNPEGVKGMGYGRSKKAAKTTLV